MHRSLTWLGIACVAASVSACSGDEDAPDTRAAPQAERSTNGAAKAADDSAARSGGPEERRGTDRGGEGERAERSDRHRAGAATARDDAEPATPAERLFERATKSDQPPSLDEISRQLEDRFGSGPASGADR